MIKNYSETFTVSATGAFDIWPKDANINVTTYDGWYFDYLTDASTDKNESEGKKWTQTISNGKTTNLPVGTDFYNKILKVNNGAVSNVYTISVEENSSDILNLTLKFNAHYIGAVYMLQIYHINAQGKTISNLEILEGENLAHRTEIKNRKLHVEKKDVVKTYFLSAIAYLTFFSLHKEVF